jgi:hypothetical protein
MSKIYGILFLFDVKFNHYKKIILNKKRGGFPVVNFTSNETGNFNFYK